MSRVKCPKCGAALRTPRGVRDTELRHLRCPNCGFIFDLSSLWARVKVVGRHRPKWLIVGVAVSLLAVAGFVGYLLGRPNGESPQAPAPDNGLGGSASGGPGASSQAFEAPAPGQSPAETLYARTSPAVVCFTLRDEGLQAIGLGSGFFVSADGLLVTNQHVIDKACFAEVTLADKRRVRVQGVLASDTVADVALVKVEGAGFPFLLLSETRLPKTGARVYAIGAPRGLESTLSEGIVSGLREFRKGVTFVQTTAPVSPGSSGGPLLTGDGRAVGVIRGYIERGQNLNLAAPAYRVTEMLLNKGDPAKLWEGRKPASQAGRLRDMEPAWRAIFDQDWLRAEAMLYNLSQGREDDPYVWAALAHYHRERKNRLAALTAYDKALKLKPEYVCGHLGRAGVYFGLGQFEKGMDALETAARVCKDEDMAEYITERVKQYRKRVQDR